MIDLSMLPDFIIEAAEHLEEMENSLLRLEQRRGKESREIMDEIFRSAHTIKGAAQFVGIDRIAELSHKLESLLDLVRKGEQPLTPAVTDLLIEAKDRIALLIEELERSQSEQTEVADLVARLKAVVEGTADDSVLPSSAAQPPAAEPELPPVEEPRKGILAEESMSDEHDEELYSIFLQQLKENIPFLYAQTVELSLSVDKQDVLYRCSDSIKSLKSSANYMGYEKLAKHYTDWQREINTAIEQLSSGKMPNLSFMQEYIDEIIRSFPQAMDGYQEDAEAAGADGRKTADGSLDSLFSDGPQDSGEDDGAERRANDLDLALDSIFSDDEEHENEPEDDGSPISDEGAVSAVFDEADEGEEEDVPVPEPEKKPEPAALVCELSEDEYDQELVAIFVRKLENDTQFLREQLAALPASADRLAVVESCREAAARLASSANYMEYQSLRAFCGDLQQALKADAAALIAGRHPDCAATLRRFLDELVRVYPQLAEAAVPPQEQPKPAPLPAVAEGTYDFDGATDTIKSLLSAPLEDEKKAAPPAPVLFTAAESAPAPETADGAGAADDQELFVRLSSALERSMALEDDVSVSEYHMDNVIGKIIDKSEPEEQEQSAATEPESKPATVPEPPPKPASVPQAEARPAVPAEVKEEKKELPPVIDHKEAVEEESMASESSDATEEEAAEEEPKKSVAGRKSAVRSSIRVDAEKIDYLMNQVGELVVSRAYFAQLVNEMRGLQLLLQERAKLSKAEMKPLHEFAFRLSEAGVHLGRVSNELQEGVMKIRMLPIDQLFKRYPRLVRDLTHRTDKDIRLITKGEETELDKMVIESISDPLIHIIRNAVDHGIETVTERKRLGKPPQGTLELEAYHESDHIVVEIMDDGRGIDPKRIKAKALEKGMFDKEELDRMADDEIIRIIMEAGFSTAEKTTETSGRGVGMDVVRKNVERLNGMVEISSKVGKGTQMRIKIPLTMAIIQALMVRVGKEKFTIPLTSVEETLRIFRQDISQIEGVDVIYIRDTTMPIFRLAKIYSIDRSHEDEDKMFVVVVSTGTQEVGLVVDELLGQEEVVIKPLADYLRAGSGFGGATILGDGGISLILDIPELVKIAGDEQADKQARRTLSFKRKRRRGTTEEEQPHAAH
ncbi:chemotaxis protein CheW [Candidatus Electronema sp. TJ]|uniref:chemotaxis protein CheW n=1 Tax=Candidatus Electronema sp. TJ TaxID=3401573 RepID=UPI003AA97D62